MKRLLVSTTALSVALYGIPPMPLMAQEAPAEECVAGTDCPADLEARKAAEEAAAAEAAAAAAAQAEAEAAAAAAAQAEAEAAARAQEEAAAAADAAAKAEAEAAAAAAAEAQAKAEAEAAAAAEAEVAAKAEAEAAEERARIAAEEAAAAQAAQEAQARADAEAAAAAEAQAAADAAAAEERARLEAEAQAAQEAQAQADADAAAAAEAQAAADAEAAAAEERARIDAEQAAGGTTQEAQPVQPVDTAEPVPPAEPVEPAPDATVTAEPAPGETVVTGEATEVTPEATESLENILVVAPGEAPAAAAAATGGTTAAPEPVGTVETVLTEDDVRASDEEFLTREERRERRLQRQRERAEREAAAAAQQQTGAQPAPAPAPVVEDDDDGLSNFEKFGLVALGALAVGAMLRNGDRVVENTGDRVVVSRSDGTYQVLKDDDVLIREPGSAVRTETYSDGSTRTIVTRNDGTQVVTIRDAAGRVLRRSSYDAQGREIVLIDDLAAPVRPIDVTRIRPAPEVTLSSSQDPRTLEEALAAVRAREARGYALSQVRDIRQVRALAPRIEVAPITFATGSSAIAPSEAEKLAELGGLVSRLVKERPNEIFLIEGHTDAVGSAASNLALSDRRAESVALALTEYFDVPPENLVVQGYGESDLLVPTDAAEPMNRRVAVRVITPLLSASR